MNVWRQISYATMLGVLRDKVLHAVVGVALVLLLLVPVLSDFSMRQVRELSITLSLSCTSAVLLLLAIMFGATSVWRDIERRYTAGLLGLPISRGAYILGRFIGLSISLVVCGAVMGTCAFAVIFFMRDSMSSGLDLIWGNFFWALLGDLAQAMLLMAIALLFSSLSTSLFLPVFGTIGVLLAGSATQEVMDYLVTEAGRQLSEATRLVAETLYYILPNFSMFDFQVQAIYGLNIPLTGLGTALAYFLIYTLVVLLLAERIFTSRELT